VDVLPYSLVVMGLACGGTSLPFLFKRRKKDERLFRFFVSFGGGVLLGAAFLHMIPCAAELSGESVGFFILLGFLSLYLLESFVFSHSCEEHDCDYHTIGLVAAVGLSVHNFVNGVALRSSDGTLIHPAAVDLAPEVHRLRQARGAHLAAFLGGLAVMWLSAQFEGHAAVL
jgi:zinc transporter ZupT